MDSRLSENNLYVELHNAVERGDSHAVHDLLKEKKANPNPRKVGNDLPLNIACKNGRMDIIRMLITNELYPANPNQDFHDEELFTNNSNVMFETTPFLQAVSSENTEVIKVLLSESVVTVNLEHESVTLARGPVTALTLAVAQENVPLVTLLLQARADPLHNPNDQNDSCFPINLALEAGNISICKMLLDAASYYSKNYVWMIPEIYVMKRGSLEILQLLVKHGVSISDRVIQNAVIGRYPDLLEYCLDSGP